MSKQSRLRALMAEGEAMMPNMGATFTPVASGKVWGGSGVGALVQYGSPLVPRDPGGSLSALAPGGPAPAKVEAAQKKLIAWVQKNYPALYDAAVRRVGTTPPNLGAEESWLDKITNAFTAIAPEYLRAKAQKDLLEVQLDRARAGLPPLDSTQYAPAVQVSVDPASVRESIATGAQTLGAKMGPLLWIVPAAIIGVMLLKR